MLALVPLAPKPLPTVPGDPLPAFLTQGTWRPYVAGDRTLVTVARSFGASTWQLYWKVLLPAIVPTVLAGMRLGIVFCLLGVLIVEMFAGVRGMGYVLGSLANGFQAPPQAMGLIHDQNAGHVCLSSLPLRRQRGARLTAPRSPRLRRRRGHSLTCPRSPHKDSWKPEVY